MIQSIIKQFYRHPEDSIDVYVEDVTLFTEKLSAALSKEQLTHTHICDGKIQMYPTFTVITIAPLSLGRHIFVEKHDN